MASFDEQGFRNAALKRGANPDTVEMYVQAIKSRESSPAYQMQQQGQSLDLLGKQQNLQQGDIQLKNAQLNYDKSLRENQPVDVNKYMSQSSGMPDLSQLLIKRDQAVPPNNTSNIATNYSSMQSKVIEKTPQEQGIISSIINTIFPQAVQWTGAQAKGLMGTAGQVGDIFTGINPMASQEDKLAAGKRFNERQKTFETQVKPALSVGNTLKTGLEVAPWMTGVGAGKMALVSGGIRGGMTAASKPGATQKDIENAIVFGALTEGTIANAGPILAKGKEMGSRLPVIGGMFGKGAKDGANKAANTLFNTTSKSISDMIAEKGKVPGDYTKYIKGGTGFDEMIGKTSEKAKGGYFGDLIKQAEDKITAFGSKGVGSRIKITADDIIPRLEQQKQQLALISGNESRIKAIDEAIKNVRRAYANGKSVLEIREILKLGNKIYGDNAALTLKEGTKVMAQKEEVNAIRSFLRQFEPIKEALDDQSNLIDLREMVNSARGRYLQYGTLAEKESMAGLSTAVKGKLPVIGDIWNFAKDKFDYFNPVTAEKLTSKIAGSQGLPNISVNIPSALKSAGVRAGTIGATSMIQDPVQDSYNTSQNPNENQPSNINSDNTGVTNNNESNYIDSQSNHMSNDNTQNTESQYITGKSPQEWFASAQNAMQDNNATAYKYFKDLADTELTQQNKTGVGKEPVTIDRFADDLQKIYFFDNKNGLSLGENTVGLGGILPRIELQTKKLTDQKYVNNLKRYEQARSVFAGLLNRARGAGTLNQGEYETVIKNMPNETTPKPVAEAWFTDVKNLLRGIDISKSQVSIQPE